MPERVLVLAGHRGSRLPADELAPGEAVQRRAATSPASRSPIAATAPAQNTFPMTAASPSIAFVVGGSASMRAASRAWIVSGTGSVASSRRSVSAVGRVSRSRSRSRRMNSSANSGLPAARSRIGASKLGSDRGTLEERRSSRCAAVVGRQRLELDPDRARRAAPGSPVAGRGAQGASSRRRASARRRALGELARGTPASRRRPSGGPRRRARSGAASASSSRNRRHAVNCSSRPALRPGLDPEQRQQPLAEPGAARRRRAGHRRAWRWRPTPGPTRGSRPGP